MPTLNAKSDVPPVLIEQALAYVTDLYRTACDAPRGTTLDACEKIALGSGRKFLAESLEKAVQARIDQLQKGAMSAPARNALAPAGTKEVTPGRS